MFIWDPATLVVLIIALAYFGSFAWIEIRSRRRSKMSTLEPEVQPEPVKQIPQTEAPRANVTKDKTGHRRLQGPA